MTRTKWLACSSSTATSYSHNYTVHQIITSKAVFAVLEIFFFCLIFFSHCIFQLGTPDVQLVKGGLCPFHCYHQGPAWTSCQPVGNGEEHCLHHGHTQDFDCFDNIAFILSYRDLYQAIESMVGLQPTYTNCTDLWNPVCRSKRLGTLYPGASIRNAG